jgi:hypothetical protein
MAHAETRIILGLLMLLVSRINMDDVCVCCIWQRVCSVMDVSEVTCVTGSS